MALAILGKKAECATVSMPGKICSEEEIRQEVKNGKIAFGFTAQHKDEVVPVLVKALCDKEGGFYEISCNCVNRCVGHPFYQTKESLFLMMVSSDCRQYF